MEDYKVNLVEDENPSAAEKEETVLENAGVDTKSEDTTYKVDLSKPPKTEEKDAVQEQSTDEVPVRDESEASKKVEEEVRSTEEPTQQEEESVLELIEDDPVEEKENEEPVAEVKEEVQVEETKENNIELPENIQKVVEFMEETGGSLEDYVRLNADYSNVDENTLLKEYYKQTKSHLDNDEVNFLIEDNFSFDEEVDDDREIRRKKLAYKEEIVKAKSFLEGLKGKYYEEVKLSSKLAPEQKEAIEFYNAYKEEQSKLTAQQQTQANNFTEKTNSFFSDEFKGFDFKVGNNKYRFKVNDVNQVKESQSDIASFLGSYLDDKGMLTDPSTYHKALFAAKNSDKIANHFYEQGKADAIKQLEMESKNINMDPRKNASGYVDAGGLKVRAISGNDSSKLRVKIKR
jgi:hypothetical protein